MRLTTEQEKIAYAKPSDYMLVRGIAGSGKTTIGLNRIFHLLNHYIYDKNEKILFVTYNKTLLNFINYHFKDLEERLSIAKLFSYSGVDSVVFKTIDAISFKIAEKYLRENNLRLKNSADSQSSFAMFSDAINKVKERFPEITLFSPNNSKFLSDEVNWIKTSYITSEEEYQNSDRIGRGRSEENESIESLLKLRKNSDVRRGIYLLKNIYSEELLKKGIIDFPDLNTIAYEILKRGVVREKYTHIIVDECQDLSKVQMLILKSLQDNKEYSSMTFLADVAQSIYPQSWFKLGGNFRSIGIDITGKSRKLNKNFRTSTEISKAAFSLIEKDMKSDNDEFLVLPTLIDKGGEIPKYFFFNSIKEESENILKIIREKHLNVSFKEIAIIGRDSVILGEIGKYIKEFGISVEVMSKNGENLKNDSIKMVTMHSAKGLEFKVVFLVGLNDGVIPNLKMAHEESVKDLISQEKALLYVAMTRATDYLYLSSSKKPSIFIDEIAYIEKEKKEKKEYSSNENISIDNYYFLEKIGNIYSKEEKVRQSIIKKLINYGYKIEDIEIEYPIQLGSKKLFADIVIKKDKEIIFVIEVKVSSDNLDSSLAQLQSYMTLLGVKSGYLISEKESHFLGENDSLFHNIATYENKDIKEEGEKRYQVINLSTEESIVVKSTSSEVYLEIDDEYLLLEKNEINNCYTGEEKYSLPSYLFNEEVSGINVLTESMEPIFWKDEIAIYNSNKEIVNNKIVLCKYDENLKPVVKRVFSMGDTILLISENSDFEPLNIPFENFQILGHVIGKIKLL